MGDVGLPIGFGRWVSGHLYVVLFLRLGQLRIAAAVKRGTDREAAGKLCGKQELVGAYISGTQ